MKVISQSEHLAVNEFMREQGYTWSLRSPRNEYDGIWIKDGEGLTQQDAIDLYRENHKKPWWAFWRPA